MEQLLALLVEQRVDLAHQSLTSPADRSSFEYGRVSGMYQGLTVAIEAVQQMLADKEERDL